MADRKKKKKHRKERLERYRAQNAMPKITDKDKKFGKVGLWIMGAIIVGSAIFFFSQMS